MMTHYICLCRAERPNTLRHVAERLTSDSRKPESHPVGGVPGRWCGSAAGAAALPCRGARAVGVEGDNARARGRAWGDGAKRLRQEVMRHEGALPWAVQGATGAAVGRGRGDRGSDFYADSSRPHAAVFCAKSLVLVIVTPEVRING